MCNNKLFVILAAMYVMSSADFDIFSTLVIY